MKIKTALFVDKYLCINNKHSLLVTLHIHTMILLSYQRDGRDYLE